MGMRVGLLAFRVGEATSSPLTHRFESFYRTVASLVMGQHTVELDPSDRMLTIPLALAHIKDDEEIFRRATAALQLVSNEASSLIVDLAHPPREDLPFFSIMQSIKTALSRQWWSAKEPQRQVFILLSSILDRNDNAYVALEREISAEQLPLVMGDGEIAGICSPKFDRKKYRRAIHEIQENPLVLLERKMIRRIGFFRYKPPGEDAYATNFFYDGRACISEVVRLVAQRLHRRKPDQIAFHAPHSSWLEDVVFSLAAQLNCEAVNLEAVQAATSTPMIEKRLAVLTPMVDSGRTLEQIHRWLKKVRPECEPRYLAILSTSGPDEQDSKRMIRLATGEATIDVDYLLRVTQHRFQGGSLPRCAREHEGSNFDLLREPQKLTSYAFWAMVAEHGYKEEEDVPIRWRSGLGHVPRFPEILESNGPWLAHKLDRLLREARPGLPTDPVVICPDEKGAIGLTDCVASMFKYNIIRVPPSVIDGVKVSTLYVHSEELEMLFDGWLKEHGKTAWFTQLNSMRNRAAVSIIAMDEFIYSGGTMTRLRHLCSAFGLQIECFVALVNLARSAEWAGSAQSLALYDLPIVE